MALEEIGRAYDALPEEQKQDVAISVGGARGLPPPDAGGLTAVWILVISIVGIVAVGGGFLAFLLINEGKNAEAIVGLASAALGGLVGLLVPSPVTGRGAGQ